MAEQSDSHGLSLSDTQDRGAAAPSDSLLLAASGLSGSPLTEERVRAMRMIFEFNWKHLTLLREFDPEEAEPVTVFSV